MMKGEGYVNVDGCENILWRIPPLGASLGRPRAIDDAKVLIHLEGSAWDKEGAGGATDDK